jgi:hypothetical protein
VRGAQFVGGVRDEVPLRLERGLKAGEQAVERVTEFPEFLVAVGQAQPFVRAAGGDRAGGGGDDPQRP